MHDIKMDKRWAENYSAKPIVDGEVCIVCGRLIKDVNRKHSVRVFWGTTAVTEAEANEIIAKEGEGGDLLYYPVGSDCLRKQSELKPYVEDAARVNANIETQEDKKAANLRIQAEIDAEDEVAKIELKELHKNFTEFKEIMTEFVTILSETKNHV